LYFTTSPSQCNPLPEKVLHREHKEIEDPEQRKKVKQRIKNAKSTWKKHPAENATKLQELEDADGTDEELAVVNKYVKNIPHREHKIIEDPKQRQQRNKDKNSIKSTRNNWKIHSEQNATKLQELEDADGTDEELAVVNKYVKKQKHREHKKIEDPEQRKQRKEDIKSITSARNYWERYPKQNATKLQELEDADGTDEELAVVNKYVKRRFIKDEEIEDLE